MDYGINLFIHSLPIYSLESKQTGQKTLNKTNICQPAHYLQR